MRGRKHYGPAPLSEIAVSGNVCGYREVFAIRTSGASGRPSVSMFGDSMTRMAFIWFVYQQTRSSAALGILMICYTGRCDRRLRGGFGRWIGFDRRQVMIWDCWCAASPLRSCPWLYARASWSLAWSSRSGGLRAFDHGIAGGIPAMIPLAGGESQLTTANALEILSYTIAGIAGPALAGVLIELIARQRPCSSMSPLISWFALAILASGWRHWRHQQRRRHPRA